MKIPEDYGDWQQKEICWVPDIMPQQLYEFRYEHPAHKD